MYDLIAYEHGADLRRAAAAHRRVASRADRARPRLAARLGNGLRSVLPHRPAAPAGCQA